MGQNDPGMRRYISLEFRAECDATSVMRCFTLSHAAECICHPRTLTWSSIWWPTSTPSPPVPSNWPPSSRHSTRPLLSVWMCTSTRSASFLQSPSKGLSVHLYIHLSVCCSVCLSVHLSFCCVCQSFFYCCSFYRFVMEPELSFEEDGR